jgi:CheY-like chemotaxis protein
MISGKTLLVVEDDNIVRQGLALLLRREGYDVIQAADGEEALALLGSGSDPDLILLDMLLPVLDGWHFLQQIDAEGAPAIPIIVVTSTVLTRQWAEDHGCCGFVKKPIDPQALLGEIHRCLA